MSHTLGCCKFFKILTSSINASVRLVAFDIKNLFLSIIFNAKLPPDSLWIQSLTVAKLPL
jgi:hypothetical protein